MSAMRRSVISCLTAALSIIMMSGCTGTAPDENKAGAGPQPIVLKMAASWTDATGYDAYLTRRIKKLSGGMVRIEESAGWGRSAPDNEAQVVEAVASGQMDLGSIGSRIFDTLGVSSFEALSAPMLLTDHRTLDAVLDSDISTQMLAGLGPAGVTGIGLADYGFRRPFGVGRPLLNPRDWRGVDFGTFRSMVQEEAIRALGATPIEVVGAFREDAMVKGEIQALQLDIGAYPNLGAAGGAKYVTTNVVLWPNVGVVVANPDVLASMSAEQRAWLQQAAADALAFSERSGGHEQQAVRLACDGGARFASASERDLEAMRRAFAGVYAGIEADPRANGYLRQIEELKQVTPAGLALDIPADCRWSPS